MTGTWTGDQDRGDREGPQGLQGPQGPQGPQVLPGLPGPGLAKNSKNTYALFSYLMFGFLFLI